MNESALRPLLEHRGVPFADARPSTLRSLAPELGLHPADLFVIAGAPLPGDLAPASGTGSGDAGRLLYALAYLMPKDRRDVHAAIRALPSVAAGHPRPPEDQRGRRAGGPGPDAPEPPAPRGTAVRERADVPGPGPLLIRLLLNRNISPWNAKLLLVVGGGPYVSPSTVCLLGAGRVPLTPSFAGGLANLLDIPAADLTAMTGVPAVCETAPHPDRAELARIAWDTRRLTPGQLTEMMRLTDRRRRADPREYCPGCTTHHVRRLHDRTEGTDDAQLGRFEQRLAALLAHLDPQWTPPPAPGDADAGTRLHHRIETMRDRVHEWNGEVDDTVAALMMAAVVEDSHVNYSMISVLHRAGRQAALLEHLRTTLRSGTPQQRARARRAWAWSARDRSRDGRG